MVEKKKYQTVIIIGNGFDLNLGLKTSYKDFISSEYFEALIKEKNQFCIYLRKKQNFNNWIDIENELKEYSSNVFTDSNRTIFRYEYQQLCNSLCDYLNNLDITSIDKTSKAYNFITRGFNNLLIVDFNYTQSIEYILDLNNLKCDVIKVHGIAKKNKIVFGVEDRASINKGDVFLKKSTCLWNDVVNIDGILADAGTIIFLGYSLGETDHHYFSDFFAGLTFKHYPEVLKTIMISFFQEDGYYDILKQVDNLTRNQIHQMRSLHDYKMFNMAEKDVG